uniref:Uncharacterized protein n=1 Tax=Oryza sativa subsp. japonica TaxID=39947 RepID=Q5Z8S1_ORYSJ|nr:hypothetical protein [Oryza sativa Japonica Group]BAD53833.1 hypothetical protein [Oryza sativa Japonica Group]
MDLPFQRTPLPDPTVARLPALDQAVALAGEMPLAVPDLPIQLLPSWRRHCWLLST